MPGMALAQSAQGEVAAPDDPMCRDSIPGVTGAAGIEAAIIPKEGAQTGLVAVDYKNEEATH